MIMLKSHFVAKGQSLQLINTYKGPYQITKVLDNTVILIDPKKLNKEA